MRVAVTGSSGMIGSALVDSLTADGHDVVRLVRRPPRSADEAQWDPAAGTVDVAAIAGVQAAVNLAGRNVGDKRWTDSFKRELRESRILSTRALVDALTKLDPLPRVLVNGSAMGFYGDRGDEVLSERSPRGSGFLPDLVRDWEAETEPAAAAGIRVALARSSLVMAARGGAFERLLPLVKFGLGGPLGSGRQWWSWITLDDEVAALRFLLDHDVSGPVNLASPEPARNGQVVRAIGRALHRPTLLPAPAFALRIALGEFAGEVLSSDRLVPRVLTEAGFTFAHPGLDGAAAWLADQA